MPSFASSTITSRTSLIISGSSAEVGSSNSIAIGSIHKARAIATRCCWPPESWAGYLLAWLAKPTRSNNFSPFSFAAPFSLLRTFTCASVRFSIMERWGNNSKCWNTIPTLARNLAKSVRLSLTFISFTRISPCCIGSKPLTVLISVDLPDPEGPQTTTTSPFFTSVEQSVSTWNWPYHLDTSFREII